MFGWGRKRNPVPEARMEAAVGREKPAPVFDEGKIGVYRAQARISEDLSRLLQRREELIAQSQSDRVHNDRRLISTVEQQIAELSEKFDKEIH